MDPRRPWIRWPRGECGSSCRTTEITDTPSCCPPTGEDYKLEIRTYTRIQTGGTHTCNAHTQTGTPTRAHTNAHTNERTNACAHAHPRTRVHTHTDRTRVETTYTNAEDDLMLTCSSVDSYNCILFSYTVFHIIIHDDRGGNKI